MIPVTTPKGPFRVWTKRVGSNPTTKLLLLHGGPALTHEYFEVCDSYLPAAGIEYYYYDQLGSAYSDQPDEPELWEIDRFVDEIEQVRQALGLDADNFFLLGHSWGGMLAIEYALRYQQHLRGLIISNMMASMMACNAYFNDVLLPAMDQDVLAEIKRFEARGETTDPRYLELLGDFQAEHFLRLPPDQWPEPLVRSINHGNESISVPWRGQSGLGFDGKIRHWDRSDDLAAITVPTLVIGGPHDFIDPRQMEAMAAKVRNGRYLNCPNGSHMPMYEDAETYFDGLTRFLLAVDNR